MSVKAPLLVLGTQRCGSTLLARILSAHPQVFVQNELPMLRVFKQGSREEPVAAVIERMLTMISERQSVSKGDFISRNVVWGLKDPQLTEYIDVLERFPADTRYIVLVRDPRAVVNSYMHNKWGLGTNAFTGAERWLREVKAQLKFAESRPRQCLVLRYEDLLNDLSSCLDRICCFLEISASAEMARFFEQDSRIAINRQNVNTTRAIDATIAEKWRKELTKREVALIEAVACKEMAGLEYKLTGPVVGPNVLTKSWLRLHQAVVGELQLQFQLKRAALRGYRRRLTASVKS